MGSKGPVVLAPGYGNAARAFALDTVPQAASPSTSASTATTSGCSTTAPAPTFRRASRSSRSTTSRCATGRPRSRTCATETGAEIGPGARRTASAACRSSWRSAAGSRACARRPSRRWPGTRSRPPANKLRAGVHLATIFRKLRIDGPEHRLPPGLAARPGDRHGHERAALQARPRQPDRPPHLLHLRRRVRPHADRRGDDERGRAELLRQRQHDVLRAHLADDPQGPRRRRRRPRRLPREHRPLQDPDLVHDRRAQPDVRPARARADARAAARGQRAATSTPAT